jgi:hypothetical protein
MLAALRDDPKKVEKWSKWADGLEGRGKLAAAAMQRTSFMDGLGKLASTRPRQGGPQFQDPRRWASPGSQNKLDNSDLMNYFASVAIGTGGFSITNTVSNAQRGLDFAMIGAAYGDKANAYLLQDYDDLIRKAGPIGKFIDGPLGVITGFADFFKAGFEIRGSNMPVEDKVGAMIMEGSIGVGKFSVGALLTVGCGRNFSGGDALACGAAAVTGVEFGGEGLKRLIKSGKGWQYGK